MSDDSLSVPLLLLYIIANVMYNMIIFDDCLLAHRAHGIMLACFNNLVG